MQTNEKQTLMKDKYLVDKDFDNYEKENIFVDIQKICLQNQKSVIM